MKKTKLIIINLILTTILVILANNEVMATDVTSGDSSQVTKPSITIEIRPESVDGGTLYTFWGDGQQLTYDQLSYYYEQIVILENVAGEGEEANEQQVFAVNLVNENGEATTPYISDGGYSADIQGDGIFVEGDTSNIRLQIYSSVGDNTSWGVTDENQASALENLLTALVVRGIGDNLRRAINWAMGGDISIDSILFNKYSNTRLAFFKDARASAGNDFLNNSGLLEGEGGGILSKYYNLFKTIALGVYVSVLLYLGIRILLGSTGKNKEKYKTMLIDWVKGVVILIVFPTIMNYSIQINDGIVSYLEETKNTLPVNIALPTLNADNTGQQDEIIDIENDDLMIRMRSMALTTGRLVYGMLYLFLIKQLIGFIFIYFKRLISVTFLIVIFPLVMISYAIDKISDGKANAFNNWFKEFNLNVYLQAFQATNYVIVMSIIFALTETGGAVNIILVLIGLEFLSSGDQLLRGMFSKVSGKAGSVPKSLSEAVKTVASVGLAKSVISKVGNIFGKVKNVGKNIKVVGKSYHQYAEARFYEKQQKEEAEKYEWMHNPANPELMDIKNVAANINVILNSVGARSPEEVQKALENILKGKYSDDPAIREAYENFFTRMDPVDREKTEKLLKAAEAVFTTLNGNRDLFGRKLTNAEININASIIMDIINGGDSGIYKDLYKYINPLATDPNARERQIVDADGNVIGNMKDVLEKNATKRIITKKQQVEFVNAQNILGGTSGLNTERRASRGESSRVTKVSGARLYSMNDTERATLQPKTTALMTKYNVSSQNAEKAARMIVTAQEYQKRIADGNQDGMTATEAMDMATNMHKIYQESKTNGDKDVVKMIDSLQDEVGFSLESFRAITATNAINNYKDLDGDESEKQEILDQAYATVLDINKNSKDKLAKNIVYRAEMDDVLDGTIKAGMMPIKSKQTKEVRRKSEHIERMKAQLEKEYEGKTRKTSSEAGAELLKNIGKTAVSVADATVGSAATLAAGIAGASLYGGISGSDNPIEYIGAMDIGASTVHGISSLAPGTEAANSKKSIGYKIDQASQGAINSKLGLSKNAKYKEINEKMIRNENARTKIDKFKSKIK